MTAEPITKRAATVADIALLHALVERAYRGETARAGWTHEADMIEGPRTDAATLQGLIESADEEVFVAIRDGRIIGCVQVSDKGDGLAYLGLLAVDPDIQASGLGKAMIAFAEQEAVTRFGARAMEMTVIGRRPELIAYYERRGFVATGEIRPFPIVLTPPLELKVLKKALG